MNDRPRPPMTYRRCWTAVIVLLLSAASLLYLFFMPGILLYGSVWLPGFLLALLAAAIGTPMILNARERTPLCRIAAGLARAGAASADLDAAGGRAIRGMIIRDRDRI